MPPTENVDNTGIFLQAREDWVSPWASNCEGNFQVAIDAINAVQFVRVGQRHPEHEEHKPEMQRVCKMLTGGLRN